MTPAESIVAQAVAALGRAEAVAPWGAGLTSLALARVLGIPEPELVPLLEAAVAAGLIDKGAGWYRTPGFEPRLTAEQAAFFGDLLPHDGAAPLVPADYEAIAVAVRRSAVAGLQAAFDMLAGTGALVRVGEHLYRAEQLAEIRARLERALATGEALTAARFRDVVGTSRKYVVPLLEFFDRTGVTRREGDLRVRR